MSDARRPVKIFRLLEVLTLNEACYWKTWQVAPADMNTERGGEK